MLKFRRIDVKTLPGAGAPSVVTHLWEFIAVTSPSLRVTLYSNHVTYSQKLEAQHWVAKTHI